MNEEIINLNKKLSTELVDICNALIEDTRNIFLTKDKDYVANMFSELSNYRIIKNLIESKQLLHVIHLSNYNIIHSNVNHHIDLHILPLADNFFAYRFKILKIIEGVNEAEVATDKTTIIEMLKNVIDIIKPNKRY